MKTKKIILSIANIFNHIFDVATTIYVVALLFGYSNFQYYIYVVYLYLFSLSLKLIANDKNDKRITLLGIALTLIFTIMMVLTIILSIKWIVR